MNGLEILYSLDDAQLLKGWKWQVRKHCHHYYLRRSTKVQGEYKTFLFHKLIAEIIFGDLEGKYIDHINGNSLDNRRENLRLATPMQNSQNMKKPRTNTSGYKGVSWSKARSKWLATINVNKKLIYLGLFVEIVDAAKAYDKAAKEHFGTYALTNFSKEF